MQILDKTGGIMYVSSNEVRLAAQPSDFAYVHVESRLDVNGAAPASYVLTLTLGVNTPDEAWLEFVPPPQISFLQDGLKTAQGTQKLI